MTDSRLPVSPQVAMSDIKLHTDNPPRVHDEDRATVDELLRAGQSLTVVIERVQAMTSSRIGASDFLAHNDVDTLAFYQGVAFALARVHRLLGGWVDGNG